MGLILIAVGTGTILWLIFQTPTRKSTPEIDYRYKRIKKQTDKK